MSIASEQKEKKGQRKRKLRNIYKKKTQELSCHIISYHIISYPVLNNTASIATILFYTLLPVQFDSIQFCVYELHCTTATMYMNDIICRYIYIYIYLFYSPMPTSSIENKLHHHHLHFLHHYHHFLQIFDGHNQ